MLTVSGHRSTRATGSAVAAPPKRDEFDLSYHNQQIEAEADEGKLHALLYGIGGVVTYSPARRRRLDRPVGGHSATTARLYNRAGVWAAARLPMGRGVRERVV